ncbi:DUF1798 family protein [Staphylococcus pettenkoferi]|uniref:DUF1798 family protein n=1 Tax=Staphylococcus pettenkoferi TaxID=170573 RepID=UPI0011A6B030|nr:DUF1798 family protein [Staphylococcus pettenkoferi]MCY1596881.1 YppE family protein [Staphylococcus pettenkoferi]
MYVLINQFLDELQYMEQRFDTVKHKQEEDSFYSIVLPYAERIDALIADLKKYQNVITQKVNYFNESKFSLLISNLQDLSVECHFARTSRKLFNEKLKAVRYDLNQIKRNGEFND